MPDKLAFKGGLDLNFFPSAEFESVEGIDPLTKNSILARNGLRLLMMGWRADSWQLMLSWPIIKAVMLQRDPAILRELRLAFQQGFEHLFAQLHHQTLNQEQSEQAQLYLSNCLSLLPLADLTPYESIKLPQCIDSQWMLVEYHVVPIELTHQTGIRRLFLQDHDRVFAYGLEPIVNHQAKPHLIFMGTTYPAGQGFVPQINTDLKGFETVGESLYRSGRSRIKEWLMKQHDKVQVCGLSLGGSLSLLLAIDQGEFLSRVDALNPAGLHDGWRKCQFDRWDEMQLKPKVVIQQQARDPVSPFGVWKNDWKILKVLPPKEKQGTNPFLDHFLNYAGFAQTEFVPGDAQHDNATRKSRNFWLYSIGRSIIYYPILVPYSFVIRPTLNFIWEHKLYFALGLAPIVTFSTLIGLGLLSVFGATVLSGLALSALALIYVAMLEEDSLSQPPANHAKLHDPSIPRNPTMDMYSRNHEIEFQLTHQQVHTYYKVMRCLVKQKDFLPNNENPSASIGGITKKELLRAAQHPENAEVLVPMRKTRAKALHMKQTLTLVGRLGIENEGQLKSLLERNYRNYTEGKLL